MTIIKTTDSMSTIQTKLNKGGDIVFNKGTYKITKQLIIPKNTTINLNGARLQRKASIQSIFINKVTKTTKRYGGDGNITISNGILEGMGGYSYDNLLTFFHSHDIVIDNVTFQDILCHGIELNSSQKCLITNCKFLGYNLKDTANVYKEMIQLDHASYAGFVLSGSVKTSPCYDGTCCDDVKIKACTFDKSNTRDYPYACIGEHAQLSGNLNKHNKIFIINNTFKCKYNTDIVQACLSFTNMENVQVYNNIFDCKRVARIYSKNYGYDVKGNKVTAKDGEGICRNISITNNIVYGCTKKEAFQQYNKSGTKNHENIVKDNNDFCERN